MKRGLWAGGLLVLSLLLTCSLLAAAEGEGEAEVWTQEEAEGVWAVCLSRQLSDLSDGRVCALLLTLELEGGMTLNCAEVGEGAAGMGLTVGSAKKEGEKTRVTLLLDGIPRRSEGGGGEPILRVFVACGEALRTENGSAQGGYMGVTPKNTGNFGLYCLEEDGMTVFIPLRVRAFEAETEDVMDSEETEDREIPTQEGQEVETEEKPAGGGARFVGCRETEPVDGYFSVQLLFYGRDTPVICGEGGGVLSMETNELGADSLWAGEAYIYEDGNRTVCTFRGLSCGRRYVFWIYEEGRLIRAVYEYGRFVGYLSEKL